jgi:hypothetical protein
MNKSTRNYLRKELMKEFQKREFLAAFSSLAVEGSRAGGRPYVA